MQVPDDAGEVDWKVDVVALCALCSLPEVLKGATALCTCKLLYLTVAAVGANAMARQKKRGKQKWRRGGSKGNEQAPGSPGLS